MFWKACEGNTVFTTDGRWKLEFDEDKTFYTLRCEEMGFTYFLHSIDFINAVAEATVKIMREGKAL